MKKHTRRIGRLLGHLLLLVSLLAALGLFTGGLATSAHAAGSSITLSASSGTPGQSTLCMGQDSGPVSKSI